MPSTAATDSDGAEVRIAYLQSVMKRRTRGLAGALALAALTLSFAEAVAASTCGPMATPMDTAVVMDDSMPGSGHDAWCPFQSDRQERDERPCPLSQAAAAGCGVTASLPSLVQVLAAPPTGLISTVHFDDIWPDLLLSHALFHPPRA